MLNSINPLMKWRQIKVHTKPYHNELSRLTSDPNINLRLEQIQKSSFQKQHRITHGHVNWMIIYGVN